MDAPELEHRTRPEGGSPFRPPPSPARPSPTAPPPRAAHPNRHRVTTTLWEDEGTLCFQVDAKGVCVARRDDNGMFNGTKLLNVAFMSRGKRDGILKNEKERHVIKVGAMHLKGVWIPFIRAKQLAQQWDIFDMLYPLFESDIRSFLYHPENYTRTQAVFSAARARPDTSHSVPVEVGPPPSTPHLPTPPSFSSVTPSSSSSSSGPMRRGSSHSGSHRMLPYPSLASSHGYQGAAPFPPQQSPSGYAHHQFSQDQPPSQQQYHPLSHSLPPSYAHPHASYPSSVPSRQAPFPYPPPPPPQQISNTTSHPSHPHAHPTQQSHTPSSSSSSPSPVYAAWPPPSDHISSTYPHPSLYAGVSGYSNVSTPTAKRPQSLYVSSDRYTSQYSPNNHHQHPSLAQSIGPGASPSSQQPHPPDSAHSVTPPGAIPPPPAYRYPLDPPQSAQPPPPMWTTQLDTKPPAAAEYLPRRASLNAVPPAMPRAPQYPPSGPPSAPMTFQGGQPAPHPSPLYPRPTVSPHSNYYNMNSSGPSSASASANSSNASYASAHTVATDLTPPKGVQESEFIPRHVQDGLPPPNDSAQRERRNSEPGAEVGTSETIVG